MRERGIEIEQVEQANPHVSVMSGIRALVREGDTKGFEVRVKCLRDSSVKDHPDLYQKLSRSKIVLCQRSQDRTEEGDRFILKPQEVQGSDSNLSILYGVSD